MQQQSCIFCKIISGQIPATVVAENDSVVAIKDIAPKAPVHILIIPKKHIESIHSFSASDSSYASDMLMMAQHLSTQLQGTVPCRLIMNNGTDVGQTVFHAHMHFLSGKKMFDL